MRGLLCDTCDGTFRDNIIFPGHSDSVREMFRSLLTPDLLHGKLESEQVREIFD